MLALLLTWLYLSLVTFPLGLVLCEVFEAPSLFYPWLPFWIGLLAQMVCLDVLAAFMPLYPAALVTMPLVAGGVALLQRSRLTVRLARIDRHGAVQFAASMILTLAVAYIVAGPILYYDTGLYHIQFMHWLAQAGLVPGLDLLEIRFGIPSDWFAIAAPFDARPLEGRLTAVADGFVVVLIATQTLDCGFKFLRARASAADIVVGIGFALILLQAVWTDSAGSASPDLPVAALTVLVAGLMAGAEGPKEFGRCWIIAFLAAAAFAIKFSAAPILMVGLAFSIWRLRHASHAVIGIAAMVAAVLAPTIYAGFVLNGCPAFPLPVACADVAWRLPAQQMRDLQQAITQFARWYAQPAQGSGPFDWIIPYFIHSGNRDNPPLVALALLSIAAFSLAPFFKRRLTAQDGWILALGGADFAFAMVNAPDTRFFVGAIAVLCGAAVSLWSRDLRFRDKRIGIVPLALFAGFALLVFRVGIVDRADVRRWQAQIYAADFPLDLHESLAQRWLVPVALPVINGKTRLRDGTIYRMIEERAADLYFLTPSVGNQCWGAALPCSAGLTRPLRLRDPERGIEGGFVRADLP